MTRANSAPKMISLRANDDCRCEASKSSHLVTKPHALALSLCRRLVGFIPIILFHHITRRTLYTHRPNVLQCRQPKHGHGDGSATTRSAAVDTAGEGHLLASVGNAAPFAPSEHPIEISETSLTLTLRAQKKHIPQPLARTYDRQTGVRGQRNVVILDEASPRMQNTPVIIRNYVSANSDDSEGDRSRIRSRRRGRRYYGEEDEDGFHGRVNRHRRSERASSPHRVSSPYPVSSSTSSDESSDDLYNFTPSYASVSSESLKDGASSVDSSMPFLTTIGASPSRTAKIMHIYKAQYTGDAFQEGSHTSRLTLLHDPRHPQQALLRWM